MPSSYCMFMAWKGVEEDQRLFSASNVTGTNFDGPYSRDDFNTSQGPALTSDGNRLYMAWKGVEGDQRLFWTSAPIPDTVLNFDGPHSSDAFNTSQSPALASDGNRLYMAWKGVEGDQRLFWTSASILDTGIIFFDGGPHSRDDFNTSQGPALASDGNRLYMAWKGVEGDQRLFWASAPISDNVPIFDDGPHSSSDLNTSQSPALTYFVLTTR